MPTSSSSTRPHRIGWAVKQAKAGRMVTRTGWKCKGQKVSYVAKVGSNEAYLKLTTRSGRMWPFSAGQRDLLEEDWALAD